MTLSANDLTAAVAEGWASASRDDPAPVVRYFEQLLDRYPGEAIALYQCARAYDFTGQPDRALPLYEQAFTAGLSGDDLRRAFASRGSTLRNLGRYDESVDVLSQGRWQFPSDAVIRSYLALALHDAGRATQAVAVLVDLVVDRIDNDPDVAAGAWALRNYAAALRNGYWSPDGGGRDGISDAAHAR